MVYSGKTNEDFVNGNYKYISYLNIYNNIAVDLTQNDFVRIKEGEKQKRLQKGDILFTISSETAEEVAMYSVITQTIEEPIYLNSFCCAFRLNDVDLFLPSFS